MSYFICPVCGNDLAENAKSLYCKNNHTFDIAKSGYVNLLLSQQIKAKHHGDDKLMVRSRQAFLNRGYYNPLLEVLFETVKKYARDGWRILDAGCGECWYTANIYDYLIRNGIQAEMHAVDISKDALAVGARRNGDIELAVASVFHLPVKENSCDMLFTFFAPYCAEEFNRVIKKGGIMIRVFPLEKHLWSLKAAIYDNLYENKIESYDLDGFEIVENQEIRKSIHLSCNEDIENVFKMTPYYYKTCAEDQKKLQYLSEIDTAIEFGILTYRKT
jgi:23S rRNA (guanine745-N1)-methyltransferase